MKEKKTDSIDQFFISFTTDYFCIKFIVNRNRFKKGYLTGLTISGKEFSPSCELKFLGTDILKEIYIADNTEWIFKTFYKWLKEEKWDKILNEIYIEPEIPEIPRGKMLEYLKRDRKDLLQLIKQLKQNYKWKITTN